MLHFFVINPRSFRTSVKSNNLKRVLADIENCFFDKRGTDYKIYMSRYPRDAVAAIHRYIERVPQSETVRVYAVGGDGILFDCLNGIIDFPNAELSMLPYGSSNDFIRSFGEAPEGRFRDIKKLCAAPTTLVDVINCGSNYAINDVGFGLEAQAVINANKIFRHPYFKWTRKNPSLVSLAYVLGGAGAIMSEEIRWQKYGVLADGEDLSGCYSAISISNGACTGGTMTVNPYAKPNDGLLDALFTASGSAPKVAGLIKDFTQGTFEKKPSFFLHKRLRKVEVKSEVPIRVNMDGESFYTDVLKMEIVPNRVKFAVPEGMDIVDYSYKAHKQAK